MIDIARSLTEVWSVFHSLTVNVRSSCPVDITIFNQDTLPLFFSSKSLSSFPVKQTDPMTAILYITSDKVHMEELKHAIHVKEIVEGKGCLNQFL
jgi:hypothetical protein